MPETISTFSKRFDSTLLHADATRHEVETLIKRSIEWLVPSWSACHHTAAEEINEA